MYKRECGALAKRRLDESLLCNHPANHHRDFQKDVRHDWVIHCSDLPVQSKFWCSLCDGLCSEKGAEYSVLARCGRLALPIHRCQPPLAPVCLYCLSYLQRVHDDLKCQRKGYASINRLLQKSSGGRRREKNADHGEAVWDGGEKKHQEKGVMGHEDESSGIC